MEKEKKPPHVDEECQPKTLFQTYEQKIEHEALEWKHLSINRKYSIDTFLIYHLGPGEAVLISHLRKLEYPFLFPGEEEPNEDGWISYDESRFLVTTKQTGLNAERQEELLESLEEQGVIEYHLISKHISPDQVQQKYEIRINHSKLTETLMCEK